MREREKRYDFGPRSISARPSRRLSLPVVVVVVVVVQQSGVYFTL